MKTPMNEKELVELFIEKIQANSISKSPYSKSYYICENEKDLSEINWGGKPDGSLRISNHWNFQTFAGDRTHCKISNTAEDKIEKNLVAKWNSETEKYELLFELSEETTKDINDLYNFDFIVKLIKDNEKFISKYRKTFKAANDEVFTLNNGVFVLNYQKELKCISKKILKKLEKEKQQELLLKISKTKKMKQEFLAILSLKEIRVYEKGSRNVKMTKVFRSFEKYKILFEKYKKENDAPRGGLIGEKIIFNSRENQALIKKILGE